MSNKFLLSNLRMVRGAIETTYGTSPDVIDSIPILLSDVTPTPLNGKMVSRDLIKPYFGASEQIMVEKNAKLEMKVELAGSGTKGTPPEWGMLLKGCGFKETIDADKVTYKVSSDVFNYDSLTLWVNIDNVLHLMRGARGTVKIEIKNGSLPYLNFSFEGLYTPAAIATMPSVVYSAWKRPLPNTKEFVTMLIDNNSLKVSDFMIDLGNTVTTQHFIGAESETGIWGREIKGDITIMPTDQQVIDFEQQASRVITKPLAIKHGVNDGEIVEIKSPAMQINNPSYQYNKDQPISMKANLSFVPLGGDDELEIIVR